VSTYRSAPAQEQRTDTASRLGLLHSLSLDELERRFRAGRVPRFQDYAGAMDGAWLHRERQPWWAAIFVRLALDSPWSRWIGKGFVMPFGPSQEGAGANLFSNRIAPLRFQFATRVRPSDLDGRPCVSIIYPRGSLMYGLIDDLREVEDGLLLGYMVYRFPWDRRPRFVGYFGLAHIRPDERV
jgi:hypothetical protein